VLYDAKCVHYYESLPGKETWRCLHAQYVHQFIQTPMIYNEFLYDSANLGFDGLPGPPWTGDALEFAEQFRRDMTIAQAKAEYLFSASCYLHETEDTNLFADVKVRGSPLSAVVGSWFFNPHPMRFVDTCTTENCNPTC